MRLKKMEITGFKSFCEKSHITFPPGVSAIVGPNGCGKSNIVDALRWAMGEQSVRQLRGKSMEDVIFAGTNGKAPLNMAEVSLVLANDNGSMPEELRDFSEVIITRRLFRSGESAYLINKQPSRLKDIHNLFIRSGMGSKSYAIIQQGNIGAITDAGPEERRFFIEQAAEITQYKNQKAEALRKVEATNQNLLRVRDIVTEVERQMNSMKRQAQKAERYKTYQEQIRRLDILIALDSFETYAEQLRETDTLLKSLKNEDVEHSSQIRNLDAAVEEIKTQREQKAHEISTQKAEKFDIRRKIDKTENDLSHLHQEVSRVSNEIEALQSAYETLCKKNENITTEIAQAEQENEAVKTETEQIKAELEKDRIHSQAIGEQLAALNQELESAKAGLMDLTAQEAKYKNICQNASNNKQSVKRRLKRIDEEETIATRKVSESEKNEAQAKEEVELLKQEIAEIAQEIQKVGKEIESKNSALANQIKLVQSLDMERNKVKSRYSTLKKMADNFDWYKDGVKAIMKRGQEAGDRVQDAKGKAQDASCKAQVAGHKSQSCEPQPATCNLQPASIIGLMADILTPEPCFEVPVEAILGEALQYVLVKDQDAGMDAISYLQTAQAGRSGFVPISSLRQLPQHQSVSLNGNRLLHHVSIQPGFEAIAEAFLGHVAVTDTMEEAINIFNKNGTTQTIVTREGDMISSQGIMVGGSKDKLSGILAKKQELKELESQLEKLETELKAGREVQKELEAEVRSLGSDLQQLTTQKNSMIQEEMEAEKALFKASEELKHARRQLEVVRLEQEQLLEEESGIEDEMEKYNKVLSDVEAEIKAVQEKILQKTAEMKLVSEKMENFNQQSVDLRLKLTNLNARWENSTHTLRRLKEFQDDGVIRLGQLSDDIKSKSQKQVISTDKVSEYEQSLGTLYEQLKQLEESLEINKKDFHVIDDKLKKSDTSISDIQTRREEISQKIRVLELEQSQRQMKQENILNQIEERYNRKLFEFKNEIGEAPPNLSIKEMKEELAESRKKIEHIGDVNLGAIEEYRELKTRFDFLCTQRDDLLKAIDDLHKVIKKINKITQERFLKTFNQINEKLNEVFPRLFDGGSASLVLTDPNNPLETGVEFMVHPPGKRLTRLSLLSGGEKALSAIAFIFSIFLIKPASFCIMDEIDAPLDEANVFRFNELLKIIGEKSQIIMITHKKRSMEFADTLFGITMEKKGVSKIVSVNLERVNNS